MEALSTVDELLADDDLRPASRAVLLLKLCQVTQMLNLRPPSRYWEQLLAAQRHLPASYREAYAAIKSMMEAPVARKKRGFANRLVGEIKRIRAEEPREHKIEALQECERKLRTRWWSLGRSKVFLALADAYAEVERQHALRLLGKLKPAVQKNLLSRMNRTSPLTSDEWTTALEKGRRVSVLEIVEEDLEDPDVALEIPTTLAGEIATRLCVQLRSGWGTTDEDREKPFRRFQRLIARHLKRDPEAAEALASRMCQAIAASSLDNDNFPKRFSLIQQTVIGWFMEAGGGSAKPGFLAEMPELLRDFALAQWHGLAAADLDGARAALQEIRAEARQPEHAVSWFLVTLVRCGRGKVAIPLAEEMPGSSELVARLRRAWVCVHPESARKELAADVFEEDLIGQFLHLASPDQRVAFLRKHTKNGHQSLPAALWTRPDVLMVAREEGYRALMSTFRKDTPETEQFEVYGRIHGYHHYCYEDVDPYLLSTLVLWDEQHPEEVSKLLDGMWQAMRPLSDSDLLYDLSRNAIFERCRSLFAAHPKSLFDDFISWLKRKLVDSPLQIHNYAENTIRTLSLPSSSLMLFAVLAAQKVAPYSPERSDQIILKALQSLPPDAGIIRAAASVYASDKGLAAVRKPEGLAKRFAEDWQLAVLEASVRRLFEMVAREALPAEA